MSPRVQLRGIHAYLGVARPPGLEDLRDARQTASDVLRTAVAVRRLGQQGAGLDLLVGPHLDVGPLGDVVEGQRLTAVILDDHLRVQVALVLHDNPALGPARVAFLAERFALDDLVDADAPAHLGQDRRYRRRPLGQRLAGL